MKNKLLLVILIIVCTACTDVTATSTIVTPLVVIASPTPTSTPSLLEGCKLNGESTNALQGERMLYYNPVVITYGFPMQGPGWCSSTSTDEKIYNLFVIPNGFSQEEVYELETGEFGQSLRQIFQQTPVRILFTDPVDLPVIDYWNGEKWDRSIQLDQAYYQLPAQWAQIARPEGCLEYYAHAHVLHKDNLYSGSANGESGLESGYSMSAYPGDGYALFLLLHESMHRLWGIGVPDQYPHCPSEAEFQNRAFLVIEGIVPSEGSNAAKQTIALGLELSDYIPKFLRNGVGVSGPSPSACGMDIMKERYTDSEIMTAVGSGCLFSEEYIKFILNGWTYWE